jgi:hypothetical protein
MAASRVSLVLSRTRTSACARSHRRKPGPGCLRRVTGATDAQSETAKSRKNVADPHPGLPQRGDRGGSSGSRSRETRARGGKMRTGRRPERVPGAAIRAPGRPNHLLKATCASPEWHVAPNGRGETHAHATRSRPNTIRARPDRAAAPAAIERAPVADHPCGTCRQTSRQLRPPVQHLQTEVVDRRFSR